MAHTTHSLFRTVFYDALKSITLAGSTLDLGGARMSDYHKLFKGTPSFTVVNIDEYYGYDLKFDVEKDFPLENAVYDNVVCLNLLEHTYRHAHVLKESFRVMRPGGKFVSVTPFAMPLHGCPHDYFRYTDSALKKMLEEAGFTVERIETMGHGPFSCAYQYCSWLLPGPLRRLAMGLAVVCDKTLSGLSKRYRTLSPRYALGYLAVARKPGA